MNKRYNNATTSMLLQSIILIIMCCACLIGSTFAWFTSRTTASVENISVSSFDIDIEVIEKNSGKVIDIKNESLLSGNIYVVNLSIKDTSTAQKGYCLIELDTNGMVSDDFTPIFQKGVLESKSIELVVGRDCKINVIPMWGTHSEPVCGDEILHFAYKITYDLDGGVFTEFAPSIYCIAGEAVEDMTLPEPTKEGFDFVGWTGSNGDVPEKVVTLHDGVFENKHYVANWSEIVEPDNEDQEGTDNEEDEETSDEESPDEEAPDEETPNEENNNGDESDENANDENVPHSDNDEDDGQADNQDNEPDDSQEDNDDKKDESDEPNGDEPNENPDDKLDAQDNGTAEDDNQNGDVGQNQGQEAQEIDESAPTNSDEQNEYEADDQEVSEPDNISE